LSHGGGTLGLARRSHSIGRRNIEEVSMGGHRVPEQGPKDDGYDEEGYDESQRAEIHEVTREGPSDGNLLTDIAPDLGDDDDADAEELDELEMDDDELGEEDPEIEQDEADQDEDEVQADFDNAEVDDEDLDEELDDDDKDALEP
jgi:hypothetical protein